jgi:hypothetical protein
MTAGMNLLQLLEDELCTRPDRDSGKSEARHRIAAALSGGDDSGFPGCGGHHGRNRKTNGFTTRPFRGQPRLTSWRRSLIRGSQARQSRRRGGSNKRRQIAPVKWRHIEANPLTPFAAPGDCAAGCVTKAKGMVSIPKTALPPPSEAGGNCPSDNLCATP